MEALHSPAMPVRFRPLLALGALVVALTFAAPVAAQQRADPRRARDARPTPPRRRRRRPSSGGGGLKTWQEVLIFAAGVILLGGIGFAIVGDARERTRKFSHHTGEEVAAGVPHKHSQAAKQRARAKARAAKAAAAQEPLARRRSLPCAAACGARWVQLPRARQEAGRF